MPRMTVAEQFIEVLRQVGVDRIYGVVGDSLNPIVDAIRRTDGIEWVHVRNEEAGAFAAGAQAAFRGAENEPRSGAPVRNLRPSRDRVHVRSQ